MPLVSIRCNLCLVSVLMLVVQATPARATTIFYEEFASNAAGWTLGSEWQIGPASASGTTTGSPDPGLDHTANTNNGVAGAVIGGNISTTIHPYAYLVSPVIDLSGLSDPIDLELWRWLNSDYVPYMTNVIDVWDGAQWQNLFATGGSPSVFDSVWTQMNFDITPHANAAFQLRVGFIVGSSGAFTVSGWNVDDVRISAIPEPSTAILLGLGLVSIGLRRWGH